MLGPQCDRSRALAQDFVAGYASDAERRQLSAHTRECSECAGELARQLQRARTHAADGHAARAGSRTSKRWRVVRNLALPSLALVLVARAFPKSDFARVELLAGEASLRGAPLIVDAPATHCARADVVATGAGSRVRLSLGDAEIVLGADSALRIEEPGAVRARLEHGEIEVAGTASIASAFGFVALDNARARIAIDAHGVSVEVRSGRATLLDSSGEAFVRAGTCARLPFEAR